jgi:hypothetical protein
VTPLSIEVVVYVFGSIVETLPTATRALSLPVQIPKISSKSGTTVATQSPESLPNSHYNMPSYNFMLQQHIQTRYVYHVPSYKMMQNMA